MPTDLITRDELKAYLKLGAVSDHDDELAVIVTAASELVRRKCLVNFDLRAYAEPRNGNGRRSLQALQLPLNATPAPTASENGTALVVAVGYSASADVIVDIANGLFMRREGIWSEGLQNVSLGYTGGYAAADMPGDLRLALKYLAGYLWKHSDRKEIGVSRRSQGQGSTDFLDDLPDIYQSILERYTRRFLPDAA